MDLCAGARNSPVQPLLFPVPPAAPKGKKHAGAMCSVQEVYIESEVCLLCPLTSQEDGEYLLHMLLPPRDRCDSEIMCLLYGCGLAGVCELGSFPMLLSSVLAPKHPQCSMCCCSLGPESFSYFGTLPTFS